MRLFWEEQLHPADEAGTPQADARIVVAREPPATSDSPFTQGWGLPNGSPHLSVAASPQYANPFGCSASTANPGLTTSKPLAL